MKTPIRLRLTVSHLVVLIVGMTLAGSLVWLAVENLYLSTQRENLLSQATLTARALEDSPLPDYSPEPYSQTTNVRPGIHTRLLNESGAVILGVPLPERENPLPLSPELDPGYLAPGELVDRPEIQSALDGQGDTAVRRIDALEGQRVLYAAAPVFDSQAQVVSLVYIAMPLPGRGLPGKLSLELLGAVLAGGLIASLIGTLLAGSIARPLERMDQAASEISRGQLDQQVTARAGVQELDNLGRTFNQMAESLRRSDELKNAFIADVTHELRTPLTVIKGSVETLQDGALNDSAACGNVLHLMSRETERLINLVNQLLLLARSDAGALALEIQPLDLAELVSERVKNLRPLAAQKDLQIQVRQSGDPDRLALGDRSRTAQVIDNLLDNALRYAPQGSLVVITLQDRGDRILCSVQDAGTGIPAGDLAKIFDRFYRVEAARDRESGGAGLGLAIARALVQAQGGSITAVSQPGDGAQLTFSLPAQQLSKN